MGFNKKRKAFTLLELIITITIMSLVLIGAGAFLQNTNKLSIMQKNEFYFQTDMRNSLLQIDNRVKKSKAVFAIQEKDFINPKTNEPYDEEWSYLGVAKSGVNKGQVCLFTHDGSKWNETVITSGEGGLVYELVFDKPMESGSGQKKISYTLTGLPNGDKALARSLTSMTEVLSAFTVVDRSKEDTTVKKTVDVVDSAGKVTGKKQIDVPKNGFCVALAFKSGKVMLPDKPLGSITFVVDVSGSMKHGMETTGVAVAGEKDRMYYVNKALQDMITNLDNNQVNVEISIVDFAQFATSMKIDGNSFTPLPKNEDKIKSRIGDISPDRLTSVRNGGTNIGDGLRLAYTNLIKHKGAKKDDVTDYIILLTDGLPTYTSYKKNSYPEPYLGDEEASSNKDSYFQFSRYSIRKYSLLCNNINNKPVDKNGNSVTKLIVSPGNSGRYSKGKLPEYHLIKDKYFIKNFEFPLLKGKDEETSMKEYSKKAGFKYNTYYGASSLYDGRLYVEEETDYAKHTKTVFEIIGINDKNVRTKFKKFTQIGCIEIVTEHFNKFLDDDVKSFLVTVGNIKGHGDAKIAKDVFGRISVAMGNDKDDYYSANNVDKLNEVIGETTNKILSDCWSFTGPKTK